MEYARLGNNELTVCPCCDKLFVVAVDSDGSTSGMEALDAMFQSHLAELPACAKYMNDLPSLADVGETWRSDFEAADAARKQRAADNPHNGTLGYWLVSGVRHEARTRASSAAEAIEKCSEVVDSWESPEAEFIGVELPDVF